MVVETRQTGSVFCQARYQCIREKVPRLEHLLLAIDAAVADTLVQHEVRIPMLDVQRLQSTGYERQEVVLERGRHVVPRVAQTREEGRAFVRFGHLLPERGVDREGVQDPDVHDTWGMVLEPCEAFEGEAITKNLTVSLA